MRTHPGPCHNRWHPSIRSVLQCAPGDEVVLETRDVTDGQYNMYSSSADVTRIDRRVVHPLTGPILVEGAEPGDVLAVEILDVLTGSFGYTAQAPAFGFVRDEFPEPFLSAGTSATAALSQRISLASYGRCPRPGSTPTRHVRGRLPGVPCF